MSEIQVFSHHTGLVLSLIIKIISLTFFLYLENMSPPFYLINKNDNIIWTNGLFGQNFRFATLSSFNTTVSGISLPSLKSIGQFLHA